MADNGRKPADLTSTQKRAIAALLDSRTIAQAAETARVGERTLRRWLTEDPAFVAGLRLQEAQLLDEVTRRLLNMQDDALDALAAMVTGAESESVRLRAALGILENVLKLRELRDIEARLTALEQDTMHDQTGGMGI